MNRLIAAFCVSLFFTIASAPGQVGMAIPSDPPPADATVPGQPGTPANLPPGANALDAARAYMAEKSWQLVVQSADERTTTGLTAEQVRELTYLQAVAHVELGQSDPAFELLQKLISGNDSDIWAGRAHVMLQPGLSRLGKWKQESMLEHLRKADRILTDLKPDDLREFYEKVIESSLVTQRHYDEQADRDYILSFFDKIIPLVSGDKEAHARILLRREQALDAQVKGRGRDEQLAGWRGIVSQFPQTRAAASAQWNVAQHYMSHRDYTPALYELNLLTNQFSGTEEAVRAAVEIRKIRQAEARFTLEGQFLPGEAIKFDLVTRNTDSVRMTARPFSVVDELKRQQTSRLDLTAVQARATFNDSVSIDRADNYGTTTRSVELKIDGPGSYVLSAEVDGKALCHQLLIISDLALVSNTAPETHEFRAVDAKSGRGRQGVTITIGHTVKTEQRWFTGTRVSYFSSFDEVRTDTNGFADFRPPDDNQGRIIAIASDGRNVALMDDLYWSRYTDASRRDHAVTYVYTDRPVYRPEQKVYWRAVVRQMNAGQYQMPSARQYKVRVRDSQSQEIWSQDNMQISDFGSLEAELDLPVGAPLGVYYIEVEDTAGRRAAGNGTFRVEEYKKPEFLVSVEAASDFAKVGDNIKARVEATYLFGAPVTDATVKYTVRRRMKMWPMGHGLIWNLNDRDLQWFEDKPERPGVLHGSHGDIVAEGIGRVDANGQFTLEFESKVPDHERASMWPHPIRPMGGRGLMIWPPPGPPGWEFQVEVTVTDASRRNIDASQVIPVGTKALWLAAKTARHLVSPGDNARVELKSHNLAQKPVATSGTLYVEKLEWDDDAKEDNVTTVSTQQVEVGSSGSLILNWRVPADVHGRLRFAYIVDDPFGGKSVAYANFTSAGPNDTDLAVQYQGVEIIADRSQYEVGDTARVMILSEHRDAEVWFWVDAGSGILEKKVLPLAHRTNFISLPITEAYVPNSMIHIVAVRDKKAILDEFELIVPATRKILNVEVLPASGKVEPGQTGQVIVRATDHTGAPVSAEFSVSIFDKAITYIAPDMREDIRRFFYGMRRPLVSRVQQSLDAAQGYGRVMVEDSLIYLPPTDGHADAGAFTARRERGDGALGRTMATAAAPMMPAAMAPSAMETAVADMGVMQKVSEAGELPEEEMPQIRTDFRDSMFWSPTVRTDAAGSATVEIKYPDSLTTWQIDAVGMTPDTRVGNATTETISQKKVLVRLQTPRFFRERDEVTISGNLHNYTDSAIQMNATLTALGVELENSTTVSKTGAQWLSSAQQVSVPAGGDARVDWKVRVPSSDRGEALLELVGRSPGGSDAMQTTVPLMPHGIDKFVAWNGTSDDADTTGAQIRTSGTGKVITRTVTLPAERIRETTRLEINVNPSLAYSIRAALPYMIEYPYGCVEQTMSRFMPAVVASRAFEKLGYPVDQTLQDKLPEVTRESLQLLRDMQLPTGGWGWWAGDYENAKMTAYVVYGLTLARQAGVEMDEPMFRSGVARLSQIRDDLTSPVESRRGLNSGLSYYVPGVGGLHEMMYAEYVLALNGASSSRTVELAWQKRDQLSARGLAMLARTLGMTGRRTDADVVLRNMLNVAVITRENNTLRWGKPEMGWRWYDDAVEATAVGLMAYLELHPNDPAVDQAMKWLVLNREGSRWKSTRDSSHAVLALTQYMLQRKEAATDATIRVRVAGKLVKELRVSPGSFWDFDGKIELRGTDLPDGEFPVEIEVDANSKIYYSIYAEYFTQEEGIKSAGNEIYVQRSYERLHREQTTETVSGQSSIIYEDAWLPLNEGDVLASGDEIRVRLKLKSLNDYEYLVFEDPKPAGMEPVDLQSGTRYGGICSNMELRDAWVAFFITRMRQGEHEITYRMRAEIPGVFHAMPTTGYAMYFPPLRTNADERVLEVRD